jgi:hypothetical protein
MSDTAAVERDEAMLRAVSAYLESHGWKVAVIGGSRVQHVPREPRFNFEFVLKFTGVPPPGVKPEGEVQI